MEFIPILERSNDICLLDFYMLDHVCSDIRRWIDEGRRVVRVSVNLSRKHMMDVNLLNSIIEIIDRHNVPHNYIEIELTETTTDVEFRDLKRVVGGLQQSGIFTSVDDFGIGYSSLNLIRVIPWNVLKVDRSFIPPDEDDKNSTNSIMFMYVVAMAKALGLECIVEGVETLSQLKTLRENHCDLAQGYLFDRPLPVKDFEDRLNKRFYPVN
jgi:EAL domain-containing protein (putative c-di-GMP-specific phosphodiesterase class I)